MSGKDLTVEQQFDQSILGSNLQRVLVMRPDTIGDVIMLSPALRALREALPHSEITLITSESGSQVTPLLSGIDHVIVYPEVWQDVTESSLLNLRKNIGFLERLRSQQFSLALIFTSVQQSPFPAAYACYLAGIPYRVGLAQKPTSSALSHFLPPPAEDVHQVDRNLKLLEALNISGASNELALTIPEDVARRANELLMENGITRDVPYIVLAPGASVACNQYAPKYFAAVAHLLAAQSERQLVIVGDSEAAHRIQPVLQVADENLYGNVHSLVGKTTIPELAAVIRQANLTISNKSASMHIAEAFHCPMIALYPRTDKIDSWRPRNTSTRLLCRPARCSLCHSTSCPYGMKCLDIRPEEVAVAALEMLADQTYEPTPYSVLQVKGEILYS